MSDPDLASRHIGVLRNAARGGQERFLVALPDPVERQRIASALANEGFVLEVESTADALARLADESFDLAFLTLDDEGENDPLAASRELRPFTDIVLITESDADRCAAAFRREVASVLPRPLPEVDALLRAHVKRLAGFRRSRTRGLLVMNAFAGIRQEMQVDAAALVAAIDLMVADAKNEPTIFVIGDAELARAAGSVPVASGAPDAVVVALSADDSLDTRLAEARARTPGAAVIIVDADPETERLRSAIYGGVRAYLPRKAEGVTILGRVAASMALRRRHEALGVRMVETLAQFGVVNVDDRTRPPVRGPKGVRASGAGTARRRAR